MADQVIVKNCQVLHSSVGQHRLPGTINLSGKKNNQAGLQYALNELHIGEIEIPPDILNSSIPGCVKEFSPPPVAQNLIHPRLGHFGPPSSQNNIETVKEEGSDDALIRTENIPPRQRRARRSAVDAIYHNHRRHTVQNPLVENETLFVPANHPLLKKEFNDVPPECCDQPFNKLKIQIVEPTVVCPEQTYVSMIIKPEVTLPLSPLAHKADHAFNIGRRASDGVNAPFKHLLYKSDNQYLKEYEELQRLQRSFTPEKIHQHQFKEVYKPDWKLSPTSSQNELVMMTLQKMHLATKDNSSEIDTDSWDAPGPCRRPPTYRKFSSCILPMPAPIRRRRAPVVDGNTLNSFDCSVGSE